MNVVIDGVEYEPIRKPLAYVEGKPVFVGDELYNLHTGNKFTVHELYTSCFDHASWLPPKPKTVIVELLREDAESILSAWKQLAIGNPIADRTVESLGKALDKA